MIDADTEAFYISLKLQHWKEIIDSWRNPVSREDTEMTDAATEAFHRREKLQRRKEIIECILLYPLYLVLEVFIKVMEVIVWVKELIVKPKNKSGYDYSSPADVSWDTGTK